MTIASNASLVDALRKYRLLEPAQLEEITHNVQARFSDPKALAGELIQQKWLTPYQANQLLQGRGADLLLGSYLLLEKLGEGGMGQVFKARNWKLGRIVALKLIRKERLDNPDAVRRFQREIRAAAALSHPNIVLAYDADQIDGAHLLVMEYVEKASDLARLVKTNGPLPVTQACEYIRQAALGLQHAHEKGMVHRDIKPANLLLTGEGKTVKVLDMGLARLDPTAAEDDKSSTMTQEGAIMGTPDYIAPEQALESHTVDVRADIYSLGCTFYFLLTGKVPFPGGSMTEKLIKHQLQEPVPVERLRLELPPGLAAVVRKMMAKKPEDRYQTPAEVAMVLAAPFGPGSGLAGGDERTMAEGRRAAAKTSAETLDSPFASLAGEPAALDSPQRRRETAEYRKVLYRVAAGCFVLVSLVVVPFLFFKGSARTTPPVREDDPPVVAEPTPKAPSEDAWQREVARLPAEQQMKVVSDRLKERNPGFDGKTTHRIAGGVVTELAFATDKVKDVSPVRALTGLRKLVCKGSSKGKGQLADLSPLKHVKLTKLWCDKTQVSDLSPLMGMPLTHLSCSHTSVPDLSPLKHVKLTVLDCRYTKVTDLSPLRGMPLNDLACDFKPERDAEILRSIKTLESINMIPVKLFWQEVDAMNPPPKP